VKCLVMLRGAIVVVATLTLIATLFWSSVASAETVGFRNPIADGHRSGSFGQTLTCGNLLAISQFADALTTRAILRNGGYERDPLAMGVVRSDVGAYGSAIVLNVLARFVTKKHPQTMCYLAGMESAAVANNLRILGRQR